MIVTFGPHVFLDRIFGIVVASLGSENQRWFLARDILLAFVEDLAPIAYFGRIIAVVAAHLNTDSDDLMARIQQAVEHYRNPLIRDCWHGGCGPLADLDIDKISIERVLEIARDEAEKSAALAARRTAKKTLIKVRRSAFASQRAQIMLAMLDAGVAYVCAHPECGVREHLTIDHVTPLSRGGSDELSNLQFLCVFHNSQKSDGRPP